MMLQHKLSLLFIFCFTAFSFAQNLQTQELEVGTIKRLELNLDEVFAIEIITGDFSTIRFISEAEGEYAEELQLQMKQIEETLYVNSLFEAILSSGFDKLSSHKVFAFQLKIFVPEQFQIYLKSNIAQVHLEGKLAYFEADLKNGDCRLVKHEGDANINTYRGNIAIETKDAQVKAETRSGKLQLEDAEYKNNLLQLKSIEGNIDVIQLD